jgi:hypothetical protein
MAKYRKPITEALKEAKSAADNWGKQYGGYDAWTFITFNPDRTRSIQSDVYNRYYEVFLSKRVDTMTSEEYQTTAEAAKYWRMEPSERRLVDLQKRVTKIESVLSLNGLELG